MTALLWCDKMYKNISKKLLHLTIEFFDFAAAFIKCLANRAEVCYTLLENEWNIRRRDSPQGLPEESPGFTETE